MYKAIEYIENTECKRCNEAICVPDCPYKLAIERLSYNVPMKSVKISNEYRCARCGKRVQNKHSYCHRCGQRLVY